MEITLEWLSEFIAEYWKLDESSYPGLVRLRGERRSNFIRKHFLLEIQDALGPIADVLRKTDHGAPLPPNYGELFERALRNIFITVLRFNRFEGKTGNDLAEAVMRKYRS